MGFWQNRSAVQLEAESLAELRGNMEFTKELPKVFIGSSMEGLDIAHAIQEELEHDADTTVWRQGIFDLSCNILDALLSALDIADFGIFVLTPDDVLQIRGQQSSAARDNVIFELGLFNGRLGKERSFLILARDHDELHLPTDLLGITSATFNASRIDKNLRAAVGPACNKFRTSIKKLGVFRKRSNLKDDVSNSHVSGSLTQESNSALTDTLPHSSSLKESWKAKGFLSLFRKLLEGF